MTTTKTDFEKLAEIVELVQNMTDSLIELVGLAAEDAEVDPFAGIVDVPTNDGWDA